VRAAALALVFILRVAAVRAADAPSLSGAWWFGDYGPEPKEAVIRVPQRCWNGGVDFTLTEAGKKVTGRARWIEATGGVPRPPRDETETLTGTRDGNHIMLAGRHKLATFPDPIRDPAQGAPENGETTVKYDLRFDPRTGHLVGSRDGRPLWLARFKTYHAECGSPPP